MGEQHVLGLNKEQNISSFLQNVIKDLQALSEMISQGIIEKDVARIGAEQEIFLVGSDHRPAPRSLELLKEINNPHFTTELGKFNIEINLDPQYFHTNCLRLMEQQLNDLLNHARSAANSLDIDLILCGILPTLRKTDLNLDNLTPLPRYFALNEVLGNLRGGMYEFHIRGLDELIFKHDNMMVEACNTSFQVHLQSSVEEFANYYNIAQLLTGPIMAIAANSPLLLGRRLWHETRIALFQQSIDTRRSNFYLRDASPRVTLGTKWVRNSILEIYQEDISRFRPLLGDEAPEDSLAQLKAGQIPQLKALRLHNGTIYRWNRACYGISDGKPHIRIENRIMPAGPSVIDEIANAAFWLGLMRAMADRYQNITRYISFEEAKLNFFIAARAGLQSQLHWFEGKLVPAERLILEQLLPMAEKGLEMSKIDSADISRYLGVIADRIQVGQTGAEWLLKSFNHLKSGSTRGEMLNAITSATIKNQKEGNPVAKWPLADKQDASEWKNHCSTVEQYMTTDLFTVHEDESFDLVINIMEWHQIRHIPVEDHAHHLVGLITYRTILHLLSQGKLKHEQPALTVADVMKRDLLTISITTTTLEAVELMQKHKISCLPVVQDQCLVGIVTERDFMKITSQLLKKGLQNQNDLNS